MLTGLLVCAAVLAAATAFGFAWRARNGRMREAPAAATEPAGATSAAHLAGSAAVAVPAGPATIARSAGNGLAPQPPGTEAAQLVTAEDVGMPLGERATLLQFSTAFCAPCRATRQLLAEVAGGIEGVAHIEIDAESRLDLVRKLGVLRTPTVFVLDPGGGITRRASGQPRKADVIAAVGDVLT